MSTRHFLNARSSFLTAAVLLAVSAPGTAQQRRLHVRPEEQPPRFRIEPYAGVSWQSTLFKPVFDFSPMPFLSYRPLPHDWEKSTQGLGVDVGTYLNIRTSARTRAGLRLNARNRYDYVYGGLGAEPKEVSDYILDAGAAAVFQYRNRRERWWMIEAGYTVNQIGKSHTFDLRWNGGPSDVYLNMQYASYNAGIGYDIRQLGTRCTWHLGLVGNYIPSGHPGYPFRDFMTLGLRSWFRLH